MSEQTSPQVASIVGLNGSTQQEEFLLTADVCTIGRSTTCDIVVTSSQQQSLISRVHARIEREGIYYILHDNMSANGTFVNKRRLHGSRQLKDQDEIGLGSSTPLLRFVDSDPTFVPSARLRYDDQIFQFVIDGKPVSLSPTQLRLLRYLYEHGGNVCSREECAMAIWGRSFNEATDNDALDRAIYSLRRTLQQQSGGENFVKTRRGMGYVLEL
jgi:DNA-binding response OmpR family regulator